MRADGAPIHVVREHLAAHGISRSFGGVQRTLSSRVYVGEIFHGANVNRSAHPAIVDVETFERVQRARCPRGRRAKSERLLARLGVLRCASCGGRMTVGSSNRTSSVYRCPATSACRARAAISANLVEAHIVAAVKAAAADVEGRAAAEDSARRADAELERAQAELDALIDLLDPLEPAARRRLEAATAKRDTAREHAERLGGPSGTLTVSIGDWDRLTLDEQRALIRATVDRATVAPGRGTGRVTVELLVEQPPGG